jgi:hypothetical protein
LWLCKPGIENNPCEPSLKTTQLSPTGQELGIEEVKPAKRRKVDCFYVCAARQPAAASDAANR